MHSMTDRQTDTLDFATPPSSRLSEKLSTRPSIFFHLSSVRQQGSFLVVRFLVSSWLSSQSANAYNVGKEDEGHKFARGAMTDAFEVRRKQQQQPAPFQGQKGSHSAHTNDNFMGHGLTQLLLYYIYKSSDCQELELTIT